MKLIAQNERPIWRSPSALVESGFQKSRVVMMNEAHNGLKRCVRTRRIGQSILPAAHASGVRHLAMEALHPVFTARCNQTRTLPESQTGYLSQPEMRAFIQSALDLGWTLLNYEDDCQIWLTARYGAPPERAAALDEYQSIAQEAMRSMEYTNWREEQQARNLIAALDGLKEKAKLLVWCGNGHAAKAPVNDWTPMGRRFLQLSPIDPFVIDQTRTIRFDPDQADFGAELVIRHGEELRRRGGTAGFLREEGPPSFASAPKDAFLLSTDNELE